MVFCNIKSVLANTDVIDVTILILIDGFLQLVIPLSNSNTEKSHNPYFNRWFSAIVLQDQ